MSKEKVIEKLLKNEIDYRHLEVEYKNDKDVIIASVQNSGYILRYLPEKWTLDFDVVKAAILNDGEAIKYAHPSMLKSKELAQTAIQQNIKLLLYFPEEFHPPLTDPQKYMIILQQKSFKPKEIQKEFINDEKIVHYFLLNKDASFLKNLPDKYKKDKALVMKLIPIDPSCYIYSHLDVQIDPEVAKLALSKGLNFKLLPSQFQNDFGALIKLYKIESDPKNLKSIPKNLKDSAIFIRKCVQANWECIQYVKTNTISKELILDALVRDKRASEYIPKSLLKSTNFLIILLKMGFSLKDLKNRDVLKEHLKDYTFSMYFDHMYFNLNPTNLQNFSDLSFNFE